MLADTDRLHSKITEMSDRIRQLEDALTIAHASASHDNHPLLRRDLLDVKSMIDLHSAVTHMDGDPAGADAAETSENLDIFGTLAVREGGSTFFGRSAGQEVRTTCLPPLPIGWIY